MALSLSPIPGVNAPSPPTGVPNTRAAQVGYYSTYLSTLPGTYTGDQTQYDGMTWTQLYQTLATQNPNESPGDLASVVLGIYAAQAAAGGVGGTVKGTGNTANAIGKGANAFAQSVPNPTSWLTGLGGDIGSGIEAALVAFLKDLWAVILGPLEIIAGVALAILILLFMFRDDLASVAALAIA